MKLRGRAIDTWIGEIRSGWGDRAAVAAQSVVPMILQWDPQPNWHQVGARLAMYGHPLGDAVEWLRLLGMAIPRRLGRSVMHPTVLTTLASGWAAGELLGRTPARDIAPLDVLRLRLRQHFQQSEELGVAADAHAAIVVVDLGRHRDDPTTAANVSPALKTAWIWRARSECGSSRSARPWTISTPISWTWRAESFSRLL